jgi:hypothetical protein
MALLCFVSEGIITVLIVWYCCALFPRESFPWKRSTAIPYYENTYDTLGNKAQQYHAMRTVMIPSETRHSNIILWEQLWLFSYYGIAVLCFRGYHNWSHRMVSLCFVSEGFITVLILWYCWQLWYPRKQSTAISYYENSYDTLGNKAQQYHTMRTVMIPSETKHINIILWEQLGIITVLIVWYCCALFRRIS